MAWLLDGLAAVLFGLRRLLRRHWPAVPLLFLLGYLVHAALWGERGLFALRAAERERDVERARVEQLAAERRHLGDRVRALAGPEVDADLVESELRRLGWVRRSEVLILDPEAGGARVPRKAP